MFTAACVCITVQALVVVAARVLPLRHSLTAFKSLAKLLCVTPDLESNFYSAQPVHDISNQDWPGNPELPLTFLCRSLPLLISTNPIQGHYLWHRKHTVSDIHSYINSLSQGFSATKQKHTHKRLSTCFLSHTPSHNGTHIADQGRWAGRSLTSLGTMAVRQERVCRWMTKKNWCECRMDSFIEQQEEI